MMWRQMFRFGLVGLLATFVHMVIGFLLIQSSWHPLAANLVAFLTAFFVSFMGHFGFSFADQDTSVASSLWKFALVGIMGFGCNEVILAGLLTMRIATGTTALFISTACAAVLTFILSKAWAFRGMPPLAMTHVKTSQQKPSYGISVLTEES